MILVDIHRYVHLATGLLVLIDDVLKADADLAVVSLRDELLDSTSFLTDEPAETPPVARLWKKLFTSVVVVFLDSSMSFENFSAAPSSDSPRESDL